MKKYILLALTLCICLIFTNHHQTIVASNAYQTQYDDESKKVVSDIFNLLRENYDKTDEEKIDIISQYFLDKPYVANRLVGSPTDPEQLVIALNELDCFTYLDYLEAFKRSKNEADFLEKLKVVRYIDSEVTYLKRKHFYSDWFSENELVATDLVNTDPVLSAVKATDKVRLNEKKDGGVYIPNLVVRERDINYVPRAEINDTLLATLKTGDYIGFRRNIAGLDVTHTGLIVQKNDGTYMRHASSSKSNYKVVDVKLTEYLDVNTKVIGILLFRSNASFSKLESTITVQYRDENNNEIAPNAVIVQEIGTPYIIDQMKINNMEFVNASDKLDSTTPNKDVVITLNYRSTNKVTQPKAPEVKKPELPGTGVNNSVTLIGLGLVLSAVYLYKKK